MKKIAYTIFVLLIIFSFSSISFAQEKQYDTLGVYVGLVGGYVFPSNMGTTIAIAGGPTFNGDTTLNNGYLYGAKVGWLTPFTKRIMVIEFEYNHVTNRMDKLKNSGIESSDVDMSGNVNMDVFMLNLLARYPQGRFHPYIGAGAGYALVKVDDSAASVGGSLIPGGYTGGSAGVFAYQGMIGMDFDITKNIIMGLSYKYLATSKFNYDNSFNYMPATTSMNYGAHNILLSVSYLF
ncbi:MAG: hypothetical protein A2W27_01155 [Deltaproteobacteria bacterium RBG_16_44_11]|nr:MAG: hypothetical protein A2W27_01155 [Deltaproteobacteria bacterium RBG_16_44_11]